MLCPANPFRLAVRGYVVLAWCLLVACAAFAPARADAVASVTPRCAVAPAAQRARVAFLALGDQGTGETHQRRVAAAMERTLRDGDGAQFAILLGDNFYPRGVRSAGDAQWRDKFESVYTGACLQRLPFYAVLGNHDHRGNIEAQIDYTQAGHGSGRWRMPAYFYTVDSGKAGNRVLLRVVFIDTGAGRGGDNPLSYRQAQAIRAAFAAGDKGPVWRIVAGHHPVRSVGRHGDTRSLGDWLLPALKVAGVDLYLSGHDHDLQVLSAQGEPLHVGSGAGGNTPYALTGRKRKDLRVLHATAGYGFTRVVATPAALEVALYDETGAELYRHLLEERDAPHRTAPRVLPGDITVGDYPLTAPFAGLDRSLFLAINAAPDASRWLVAVARFAAGRLVYVLAGALAIAWLRAGKQGRRAVLFAGLGAALGLATNFLISLAWFHPRPFMLDLGTLWMPHVAETSFPSDHATLALSVAFGLLAGGAGRGAVALALAAALAIAWARVYVGVHFPLDMAGSLAVAGGAALVLHAAREKVDARVLPATLGAYIRVCRALRLPARVFRP